MLNITHEFKKPFLFALGLITVFAWGYVVYRYEDIRLFAGFLPLVIAFNTAKSKAVRNVSISIFVILWVILFHYESIRYFYLNSLFNKELPKTKFLFPPAGWIMFYNVDRQFGHVEVYGMKGQNSQLIDPHDIFRTRTIGFDNIHRGILGTAANQHLSGSFCRFLSRRFPYFDRFVITTVYSPDIVEHPYERFQQINYQCTP